MFLICPHLLLLLSIKFCHFLQVGPVLIFPEVQSFLCNHLFIFGSAGFLSLCRLVSGCGARASHCGGFSCRGAWLQGEQALLVAACRLQGVGSVVVAHGLSCSEACGIFMDQGLNPCLLHWQVGSLPLSHRGSLVWRFCFLVCALFCVWSRVKYKSTF